MVAPGLEEGSILPQTLLATLVAFTGLLEEDSPWTSPAALLLLKLRGLWELL